MRKRKGDFFGQGNRERGFSVKRKWKRNSKKNRKTERKKENKKKKKR